MDTNWKHQKDAMATDKKTRTDDEHIHEQDKAHLKQSEEEGTPEAGATAARRKGKTKGN